MGSEAQIRGVGLTAFWDLSEKDEDVKDTIACLDSMARSNKLKPILGESYKIEEAIRAHMETIENNGCHGKKYFSL